MGKCLERCSHWMEEGELPAFAKLDRDLTADVVVIGGGFTGIATAYALKRAGLKVALLEKDRCANGDTGHTTAHLTHVTDTPLTDLAKRFGKDHAAAAWDAGKAALDFIEAAVKREWIACEMMRVPGFRHVPRRGGDEKVVEALKAEAALAEELGFEAEFMDRVPVVGTAGVQLREPGEVPSPQIFARLAQVHSRRWVQRV